MKKVVNYKVEGKEWEDAKDKAFKKVVKKAKVDGFREGKVPRNVYEKKYGTNGILEEAMESELSTRYYDTLIKEKLYPIIEPKLDIVKLDNDGFEANITIILEPEVKLGKYKELGVKKDKVSVTKKEIEHEISHILDRFAELVSKEGTASNGDTVIIDFKGYMNNEEFEGGSAENYSLELGSNSFIPGFEDGIIGMKKNESKDISLTFPKDYLSTDLAGKEVTFNVLVHDIKERVIPTLDEEFFKDLDMEGVTSKEELEEKVRAEIEEMKEENAERKFEEDLLDAAVKNMTIDLDEEIIDHESDYMYKDFVKSLEGQGISEELYYAYSGLKKEDIQKDIREQSKKRLLYTYLLNAIALEEKIEISDKEIEDRIKEIIEEHNSTDREEIVKSHGGLDGIKYNLIINKALDILKENN